MNLRLQQVDTSVLEAQKKDKSGLSHWFKINLEPEVLAISLIGLYCT